MINIVLIVPEFVNDFVNDKIYQITLAPAKQGTMTNQSEAFSRILIDEELKYI